MALHKKLYISCVAAALLVATASSPVTLIAQPSPPPDSAEHGGHGKWGFMEILKELNLTPEQKAKLKELRGNDNGATRKERFQAMQDARKKLRDLLRDQKSSEQSIYAAADEMAKLHDEMMKRRIAKMIELRKILTPEQFKTLSDKIEAKMKDKFGKGGGGFGHGFGGARFGGNQDGPPPSDELGGDL